ncbi:hypothetical protein GCM10027022_11860 [Alpinimonas psychrophila]|uniref:Uncharacterized protein n=1 Tax=Alpinimonas psychrophila TaxID=748908 RepID=A0A7W3JTL0_9MICO|nr:hypothetical protein [Alpinimonas psychrophila]MBA8829011.1 hypothetical protein [Alpinimonas psychrophila]
MRKFLFNASVLGAIFGGVAALRETIRGPRDWRVILMWIGWAISVALAVGAVIRANEEAEQARLENADDDFS